MNLQKLTLFAGILLLTVVLSQAAYSTDSDGDGIEDSVDNCAYAFNPDQADSNSNGIGDICDVNCEDINNDGSIGTPDFQYYWYWMWDGGPPPPVMMAANCGGCSGINIYDYQIYNHHRAWGYPPLKCWHQIDCEPIEDSSAFILDHVDGLLAPDTIPTDQLITFHLRLSHHSLNTIPALTNGFRIYSPTGAEWDTTTIEEVLYLGQLLSGYGMTAFSTTGSGADTVGLHGVTIIGAGFPQDFDTVTHTITIGPIDKSFSGGVICLDSSWYPPVNEWMWVTWNGTAGYQYTYPSWDGPHCFNIQYCCEPRGDVDHFEYVNISDLTYLVAHLFQGGAAPICVDQGDIDASGTLDISDLTYLVAYLFLGGPAPPPCL